MSADRRDGALTGTVLADRYRLDQRIGRGGMAEVYAGDDLLLERRVAVKVVAAHLSRDERFAERFRREARSAARLTHPNVVAIHDTGEDGGVQYLVMELVQGRPLDEVLTDGGLPRDRAVAVCADVCAALQAAHDAGVIHRDVKPGNVLLTEDGTVKVTDFGIARAVGTETITTTSVFGTATYLAPEQARGGEVDHRADLYALGVVLYELCTGRPPFTGASPVQVALKHVADTPTPPRELDPTIAHALEAVILTALAKDAGDRYPTAADFRDDLLALLAGEDVLADGQRALRAASGLAGQPAGAVATVPVSEVPTPAPTVPVSEAPPPAATVPVTAGVAAAATTAASSGPADERPPRRAYTAIAVLAGAALLALLVAGNAIAGLRPVPDVVGRSLAVAAADLEDAGLEVAETGLTPDAAVPAGHVSTQDPPPARLVEMGTVVRLSISSGPPVAEEPPAPSPTEDAPGGADDEDDEDRGKDEEEDEGRRGRGRGRGEDERDDD